MQADGMPLEVAATEVNEVISVDTARTMMQLLQAVTHIGTGAAAAQLKHPFGGKTGTTNDFTDAWFIGFSPSVTCGTWIGFDDRQSLGEKETGAKAALPMWMDFMRAAIAAKPNEAFPSGGDPKKVLDVPEAATEATGKAKRDEDADPDAPVGTQSGQSAKDTPVQPAVTAPAKAPEEPRSGVSNPPPDTN
jgi:penicillin-binding protein 1A